MNLQLCNERLIWFFSIAFPGASLTFLFLSTNYFDLSKYEEEILTFILFFSLIDLCLQFLVVYTYIFVIALILCGICMTNAIYEYRQQQSWLDLYFIGYISFCVYKYTYLKVRDVQFKVN